MTLKCREACVSCGVNYLDTAKEVLVRSVHSVYFRHDVHDPPVQSGGHLYTRSEDILRHKTALMKDFGPRAEEKADISMEMVDGEVTDNQLNRQQYLFRDQLKISLSLYCLNRGLLQLMSVQSLRYSLGR